MNSATLPVIAGTAPVFAAPLASDTVEIGSTLIVKNTSAAAITVTLVTPATLGTGDAYPDKVYTVPATNGELWIPVLRDYKGSNGLATVNFSATAGVTAASIHHN